MRSAPAATASRQASSWAPDGPPSSGRQSTTVPGASARMRASTSALKAVPPWKPSRSDSSAAGSCTPRWNALCVFTGQLRAA